MLSVRLVTADHCQAEPAAGWDVCYSEFRGRHATTAPVIRVFGATADGTKACVHVHGVLPYLYVPFDGSGTAATAAYQLAAGLDRALALSSGVGGRQTNALHVHKVVLVAGIPFYGYHKKSHLFFKIFLYNPRMVSKAAELLQSGAVLHRSYQPHEVHIPYLLQFFIDFNLQGMNMMHVSSYKVRAQSGTDSSESSGLQPVSSCPLEIDVHAAHILNRTQTGTDAGSGNPGLAAIWQEERARRRQLGDGRDSQPTPEPQDSRPAPRQSTEIAALAALAARLSEQSQSQLELSSSEQASQLDATLPAECADDSVCPPACSLGLPELSQVASVSPVAPGRPPDRGSPPPGTDVDEQLVLELSQRADSSVRLDSQDDSLAAALLCLLSPGGEERHSLEEQREQDAQDAADELEMSQVVWSQHDERHHSPTMQPTRSRENSDSHCDDVEAGSSSDGLVGNHSPVSAGGEKTGLNTPGANTVPSNASDVRAENHRRSEESGKDSPPPVTEGRQTAWRLPQLDGAGDEEPPPDSRRVWRLGTTGRRWASSSSGVGGAFKPVVETGAPSGVAGPAGDGLGGEDAPQDRWDGDGVRTGKTSLLVKGSSEKAGREAVRLVDDDLATGENAVSGTRESTLREGCATAMIGDDKLILDVVGDVSVATRANDRAMVKNVLVDRTAGEVSEDVLMPERTENKELMGELREDGVMTDDISDCSMADERTMAVTEKDTVMPETDRDEEAMNEDDVQLSISAQDVSQRAAAQEVVMNNDCMTMNPNEMDCAGLEEVQNDSAMIDEPDSNKESPEQESADETMTEGKGQDQVMTDDDRDNENKEEITDAIVSENSGDKPRMEGEISSEFTMTQEITKPTAQVRDSLMDVSMPEKCLKNTTVADDNVKDVTKMDNMEKAGASAGGGDENVTMCQDSASVAGDAPMVEIAGNSSKEGGRKCVTDGEERGEASTVENDAMRPDMLCARNAQRSEEQQRSGASTLMMDDTGMNPEIREMNTTDACTNRLSAMKETDDQSEPKDGSLDVESSSHVDGGQKASERVTTGASRLRIVSQSDSEFSVDSASDTNSLVSMASLLGSPVVVLSSLDVPASGICSPQKTPKKSKRSAFRLSARKYERWRRRERAARAGHVYDAESARRAASDARSDDDDVSLSGGSEGYSSKAESERSRYSWRYTPTVDLGMAWLALPAGQTESDVWRAVSAAVLVSPEERAAADRAKGGPVCATSTHSSATGRSKDDNADTRQREKSGRPHAKVSSNAPPAAKKLSYTEKLLARLDIDLDPIVRVERLSLHTLSKPQKPTGDLFKLRLSRNANKLSLSRSLAERAKASSKTDTSSSLSAAARKAKSSITQAKRIMNSPTKSGLKHPQMRITSVSPTKATKLSSSASKVRPSGRSPASARKVPLSITVSPQKRPGAGTSSQPSKKARVKITPLRPLSKVQPKAPNVTKPSPSAIRRDKSQPKRSVQKGGSGHVEVLRCPHSNLIWDGHNFVRPPSPEPSEAASIMDKRKQSETTTANHEEKRRVTDPSVSGQEDLDGSIPSDPPRDKGLRPSAKQRPFLTGVRNPICNPSPVVTPEVSSPAFEAAQHVPPPANPPWHGGLAQNIGWMGSQDCDAAEEEVDVKPVLCSPVGSAVDSPMRSPVLPLQVELTVPPSPQSSSAGPAGSSLHREGAVARNLFTVPVDGQQVASHPQQPKPAHPLVSQPTSRSQPPLFGRGAGTAALRQRSYRLTRSSDGSLIAVPLQPDQLLQPQPSVIPPPRPPLPPPPPPPPPPPSQAPALRPSSSLTPLVGNRLLVGSIEVTVGAGDPPVVAVRRIGNPSKQPLTPEELNSVHSALQNALKVRGLISSESRLHGPQLLRPQMTGPAAPGPVYEQSLQFRQIEEQRRRELKQLQESLQKQLHSKPQQKQGVQVQQPQQVRQEQQQQQQKDQPARPPPHLHRQPPLVAIPWHHGYSARYGNVNGGHTVSKVQFRPILPNVSATLPSQDALVVSNAPSNMASSSCTSRTDAGPRVVQSSGQSQPVSLQQQERQPASASATQTTPRPRPPALPRCFSPVSYMAADSTSVEEANSRSVPAAVSAGSGKLRSPPTQTTVRKSTGEQHRSQATTPSGINVTGASSSDASTPEPVIDDDSDWEPGHSTSPSRTKSKRSADRLSGDPRQSDHTYSPVVRNRKRVEVNSRPRPASKKPQKTHSSTGPGLSDITLESLLWPRSSRVPEEQEDSMRHLAFLSCSSADNSGDLSPPEPTTPRQPERSSSSGPSHRSTGGPERAKGSGGNRSKSPTSPGRRPLSSPELFEPLNAEASSDSDSDDVRVESPIPQRSSGAISSASPRPSGTADVNPPRLNLTVVSDTANASCRMNTSVNANASTASAIRIRPPLSNEPSALSQAWSFGVRSPRMSRDPGSSQVTNDRRGSKHSPSARRVARRGGGSARSRSKTRPTQQVDTFGTEVLIPVNSGTSQPRVRTVVPDAASETHSIGSERLAAPRPTPPARSARSVGTPVVGWNSSSGVPVLSTGTGTRPRDVANARSKGRQTDRAASVRASANTSPRARNMPTARKRTYSSTNRSRVANSTPDPPVQLRIAEVTSLARTPREGSAAARGSTPGNDSARTVGVTAAGGDSDDDEITMVFDSSQRQVEVIDLDDSSDEGQGMEAETPVRDGSCSQQVRPVTSVAPCSAGASISDGGTRGSGSPARSALRGRPDRPSDSSSRTEGSNKNARQTASLRAVRLTRKRDNSEASQPRNSASNDTPRRGDGDGNTQRPTMNDFFDALTIGADEVLGSDAGVGSSLSSITQDAANGQTSAGSEASRNLPSAPGATSSSTEDMIDVLKAAARESLEPLRDASAAIPQTQEWDDAEPDVLPSQGYKDPGVNASSLAGTTCSATDPEHPAESKGDGGRRDSLSSDDSLPSRLVICSPPSGPNSGDPDPSSPRSATRDDDDADESAYLPIRMSCLYDGDASLNADSSSQSASPFIRVESGQKIPRPTSPVERSDKVDQENVVLSPPGSGPSGPGSPGFDDDIQKTGESLFDMVEAIEQDSSTSEQPCPTHLPSATKLPSGSTTTSHVAANAVPRSEDNGLGPKLMEPSSPQAAELSPMLDENHVPESSVREGDVVASEAGSSPTEHSVERQAQPGTSIRTSLPSPVAGTRPEPSKDSPAKTLSPCSPRKVQTFDDADMFDDSLEAYSLSTVIDQTDDSMPPQKNPGTGIHQRSPSPPKSTATKEFGNEQEHNTPKDASLPKAGTLNISKVDAVPKDIFASSRVDTASPQHDETASCLQAGAGLDQLPVIDTASARPENINETLKLSPGKVTSGEGLSPKFLSTVTGSDSLRRVSETGSDARVDEISLESTVQSLECFEEMPHSSSPQASTEHDGTPLVGGGGGTEPVVSKPAGVVPVMDASRACLSDTSTKATAGDTDVSESEVQSHANLASGSIPTKPDFCEAPLVLSAGAETPASAAHSNTAPARDGVAGSDDTPVGLLEGGTTTDRQDRPDRPNRNPNIATSCAYSGTRSGRVCLLLPPPPTVDSVMASLRSEGLPSAPTRPVLGVGRADSSLPPFEGEFQSNGLYHWRAVGAAAGADAADVTALVSALGEGGGAALLASRHRCTLTPARPPPSRAAVMAWLSGRRPHRSGPKADSSDTSASDDTDSEDDHQNATEPGENQSTTAGPSSASTPLPGPASSSGRPPSALGLTPVCGEPAVRRSAAYGTVTSVLTPVRPRPTRRRRLVPPLPGPAAGVENTAAEGRRRLERVAEVEEGRQEAGSEESGIGERPASGDGPASGEAENGGRSGEAKSGERSASGEAESEELSAVTGGSSSQETRFSATSGGRDPRLDKDPAPVTPGPDLTSPLLPSAARRHMTSPLEPSLLISPSFGLPRANSTDNSFGFKMDSDNLQEALCSHEYQYLTCLSLEVHALTRADLRPDPEHDALVAVFYHITDDVPENWVRPRESTGCIVVDAASVVAESAGSRRHLLGSAGLAGVQVRYVADEHCLLDAVVELVAAADPDILLGWEVQQLSWGYVLERAECLGRPLTAALSRLPLSDRASRAAAESDLYGSEHTSEIHLAGRIVLNVWRLLRPEVALYSYTFENIAYHVLHQRVPEVSYRQLAEWWRHPSPVNRWRVAEYYTVRSRGTLQILSRLDIIGRTAELARLFGIQFFDVISRGSQFRVESMMLRLAKPRNMVPVSPSVQQRAAARAPETLPLILEPESKMYTDPVVVLDFQSLYPSMIIAYNYCFSTCLGRVEHLGQRGAFPMGCTALQVPPAELARLLERDQVHVSPSGVAFVKRDCRRGLLPDMLEEILNTRIMVKKAMKANKDRPAVRRVLDFKQLGLKLIANVTYGYTSANFSGRMPCIEVGDSVVSKGRETLERAIRTIESRPEWAARVIYGDTDSLFILLKGRGRSEAFQLGEEMAAAVTAENPDPVKLKFEKVYQPCILQTKKRYVGFMYETADQQEPVYDAKGIETVRRDGCPAVAKILEKSLRLLFTSHDMSVVRRFVTRQFEKFHRDAVSTTDLLFAREYRGRASYQPTACVPALRIADRLLRADRRAEPRVGQRVPYAVVYGAPGLPLIELVRTPAELLAEPSLRLNAEYYVSRAVAPPLQRCLGLLGVDVMSWYAAVPRRLRLPPPQAAAAAATISRFFAGRSCAVCARASAKPVCSECAARPLETVLALQGTVRRRERTLAAVREVCAGCCGLPPGAPPVCVSADCPVLWSRTGAERGAQAAPHLREVLQTLVA